jgi:trans-L-3-hydroxyproline dehydratase
VNEHIDYGRRIKRAVMEHFAIRHPTEPDLSFLYGTIFTGPPSDRAHHSRNVCVFADGEIDRSATGSGVSARAALHHARGELALHAPIVIESILGTTMTVAAVETTTFGGHAAVIPEVSGTAHFTGRHEFAFDPDDLLARGFLVR